jgi:hypothetical protein
MSKLPDEAFRDTIGTIDDEGKREFIFPKSRQENSMTIASG